jgi:hypothetical protein
MGFGYKRRPPRLGHMCSTCGTRWRYAGGGCIECAKARSAAGKRLPDDAVMMVNQVAAEICASLVAPEITDEVRVLVASLFTGCSEHRISRSLGLSEGRVASMAVRLRQTGVWPRRGPHLPASTERGWFSEDDGNLHICLDAMVAAGLISKRMDRYCSTDRLRHELTQAA